MHVIHHQLLPTELLNHAEEGTKEERGTEKEKGERECKGEGRSGRERENRVNQALSHSQDDKDNLVCVLL